MAKRRAPVYVIQANDETAIAIDARDILSVELKTVQIVIRSRTLPAKVTTVAVGEPAGNGTYTHTDEDVVEARRVFDALVEFWRENG